MSTLEDALREIAALRARIEALEGATGLFASDKDMAGPKGDPIVRFEPRGWRGATHKDKHYSECSPEFLDALAEQLSWSAANPREGKEKYASYDKLDAARARSWARRLRAGGSKGVTADGEIIDGQFAEVGEFEAPDFAAPDFDGYEAPL